MPRYQQGSLEEAIRNLCFDAFTEAFMGNRENEKKGGIDFVAGPERTVTGSSTRARVERRAENKGRVTNPQDKRLKRNREA